ncbi:D-sedoheptulose-7-phosphate isomerase [Thermomonospora catenispora]|uniref:D-sedoheptulose-7-phosphate isomerase n=1 Tax=Thermomonospora catenispora TaxID=2493090 RepID=UPI001121906F|nr:SIS domain-containing protein [Thermomonospora catenispora]TNY38006.1 SIS domain-containing protein [Thermomonospora catenispora]
MSGTALVEAAFQRREAPGRALIDDAEAVARACRDMARRFHRGGRLLVFGSGASATDAQHIAVEFVHPVVVGTRALPAMSLSADPAALTAITSEDGPEEMFAAQLRLLAAPDDIVMGVCTGSCPAVRNGLAAARERGALTVALTGADGDDLEADHRLVARCADPTVAKEIHVTIYHVLWELVHVFLERIR